MHPADPVSPSAHAPDFVPLRRRAAKSWLRVGCLTRVGGLLTAFGIWLVAYSALVRPESPTARAQIAAGVAIAGVGALLVVRMLRRAQASAVSRVELALAAGSTFFPGASVPLRVRLAGPARVDRLVVRAMCERDYTRQVMAAGSTALSTTHEVEELWRQDLLDERGIVAPTRAPVDRTFTFTVSTLARATGPILPAGTVRWRIEVASGPDASVDHDYEIVVSASADAAAAVDPQPPAGRAARPFTGADLSTGIGCAALTLGFLLAGPFFLWLYFSDVPTKKGNPVMALVAGVIFSGVGLLALVMALQGHLGRGRQGRPKTGQSLPR